jgi:hypothetical protein
VRLLDDVLGIGERAEHPVGDAPKEPAVPLEGVEVLVGSAGRPGVAGAPILLVERPRSLAAATLVTRVDAWRESSP